MSAATLVVGLGNRMRGDDGAGLEAARMLAAAPLPGVHIVQLEEPLDLLDVWTGVDEALVIDAVCSSAAPGTVVVVDVSRAKRAADIFGASTHALGVVEAIELARALGRCPAQLRLYGIHATCFDEGAELTPPVRRAARRLAAQLRRQLS